MTDCKNYICIFSPFSKKIQNMDMRERERERERERVTEVLPEIARYRKGREGVLFNSTVVRRLYS
jgi:hypothetical protein